MSHIFLDQVPTVNPTDPVFPSTSYMGYLLRNISLLFQPQDPIRCKIGYSFCILMRYNCSKSNKSFYLYLLTFLLIKSESLLFEYKILSLLQFFFRCETQMFVVVTCWVFFCIQQKLNHWVHKIKNKIGVILLIAKEEERISMAVGRKNCALLNPLSCIVCDAKTEYEI